MSTSNTASQRIRIEQVIRAWSLVPKLNTLVNPGASEEHISNAEQRLGCRLPHDLRAIYVAHDGGWFVNGTTSVVTLAELTPPGVWSGLRDGDDPEDGIPYPPELLVFGHNGGDEELGVWIDRAAPAATLGIMSGDIGGIDEMAVCGDDLAGMLAARTAFYLLLCSDDLSQVTAALDAIGFPRELSDAYSEEDDDFFDTCHNWANPNLPDKTPDCYGRAWSADRIRALARSRA